MALASLAYFGRLLADPEIEALLGLDADIRALLAFERGLARVEGAMGLIPAPAAYAIIAGINGFKPDIERLTAATFRDGVVVPDLVAQLREAIGGDAAISLHFGATSQDVVDTALALKLLPVFALLDARLRQIADLLRDLTARFGDRPLMGYSRMQAAIPITVADRLTVWRRSVERVLAELPAIRDVIAIVSLAGAAGTAEKFGDRIGDIRSMLAAELGLSVPDYIPHADRGRIADLANWLSRITGALGKIGQDAALMAQTNVRQISIAGSGGSSAMPHKQNPVRAEVLVALARYNAAQLAAIHAALVHEQERSGSAWTLEWMVLPSMIEAAGVSLLHAASMLSDVQSIGDPA